MIRASFVACAMLLSLSVVAMPPAHAQETGEGGLGGLLKELLRGSGRAETPADGQTPAQQPAGSDSAAEVKRRVPFGQAEIQLSFAPLVKESVPAVVNVYASQQVRMRSPFAGDPFFEEFFGRQQMPPRVQASLGSGVLVDPSGLVVTNFHVIRDSNEIKVATSDGREFESKVLLKDETLDLAVLKIEAPEPFPAIPIGDSEALEVGDLVLAIGNPFGVGQTTTSGIVSALARSHIGISDFGFFIQTDAAINPGNSGGALIDMSGRLVGINTAIFSRSGGSIGIGFAIPSNIVRVVVEVARKGGDSFERPFIGASFEAVTAQIAEALGLPRPSGAIVADVIGDGPADRAGLRPGDVILAINKAAVEHVDALGYRLATLPIGGRAELLVLSKGAEKTVTIELVKAPADLPPLTLAIDGRNPFTGTKVADLTPKLAERYRVAGEPRGAAVIEVADSSPAADIGLRVGDVIREVNGRRIGGADDLKQVVARSGRTWRFTVERQGRLMQQSLRF